MQAYYFVCKMLWQTFLITSIAGFCLLASGVAPGDESKLCIRDPRFATFTYPSDQRVLLDSYNYHYLLQPALHDSPWIAVNVDHTGNGWVQGAESICRKSVRVCDFESYQEQNNWLFTQYVSYHNSREVNVNISFSLSECRNHPSCDKLSLNVYIYSTSQQDIQERINTVNYELLGQIRQPNNVIQTLRFERPLNHHGFYLGIEDQGSCGSINRIQVYYKICPATVAGLTTYPSLALPPCNASAPNIASAVCAPNAVNSSALELSAFENGTCHYAGNCVCKGGYQEQTLPILGSSLELSVCGACPAGTYKDQDDISCQPCPRNTNTSAVAALECACIEGYFRTPTENSSTACSSPPGPCQGIQVVSTTDSGIQLRWRKPEVTGRSDYYYNVYYSNPDSAGAFVLHNTCPHVNSNNVVEYSVNKLVPQTNYTVMVVVENGVSNQDTENIHTCEVKASTSDGSVGIPTNVNAFCQVVTWEPPVESGAIVTGYDVQLVSHGSLQRVLVNKPSNEVYHIIQEGDEPSDEQDTIIQIRAKSSTDVGPWSDEISLGCKRDCQGAQVISGTPSPVTGVDIVNKVLVWNPPLPVDNVTHYHVRYQKSGDDDGKVVSVEQPLHAFVFDKLEPGSKYTVEVRSVNSFGPGNWSEPYQFSAIGRFLAILKEPESIMVRQGNDVELICTAIGGSGSLMFLWGTTASITTSGLPHSVETNNSDGSVTSRISLSSVSQDSVGEYLCIVMDTRGSRIVSLPANLSVFGGSEEVMVMFQVSSYEVSESNGHISIDVVKVGNNSRPFSVRVSLDRSNDPLVNRRIVSSLEEFDRVLTFEVLTSIQSVSIPIRDDEVAMEDTETLVFQLAPVEPSSIVIGDPSVTRVQIQDDESLGIGFRTPLLDREERSQEIVVCIRKSHATVVPLAMNLTVRALSATPGEDYVMSSIPRTVVFEGFRLQQCFTVEVIDDEVNEETEMFQIKIDGTNSSHEQIVFTDRVATIRIIDDDDETAFDLMFSLNGRDYFNNSVIALEEVGAGDTGLMCVTTNPNCCTGTNRAGEFYYPSGEKVPIRNAGDGFYRDRGDQFVRLNRLHDTTSPIGKFQCEIPNNNGVLQNVSIIIDRNSVSFSQTSYFFLENSGEAEVCVERLDIAQVSIGSLQVEISGRLQEETGLKIDQTLTFLPSESQICISFAVVDDEIALEDTEMLTFSIDSVSTDLYVIGDFGSTTIGIVDDDEVALSLRSLSNVTEGSGTDVCVYFSSQFTRQFDIQLATFIPDTNTFPAVATVGTDFTLQAAVSADLDASAMGSVCAPLQTVDDSIIEPIECVGLQITVSTESDQIKISAGAGDMVLCILDNDKVQVSFRKGNYVYLESDVLATICIDKNGQTEETAQVMVSGALQQESTHSIEQILTFLPREQTKCVDVPVVDDNIALEYMETLTFTLSTVAGSEIAIGDNNLTTVGVLDDDELILTFSKSSNVSEGETGEVCIGFSNPFAEEFRIPISTAIPANISIPNLATPDIDYTALPLSILADANASTSGKLCFAFEIFDDAYVEPVECLPITISVPDESFGMLQVEPSSTLICCITDNDVVIGFDPAVYTVSEGAGHLELTVRLLEGHPQHSFIVSVSTTDGTAIVDEDYSVPLTDQLQFDSAVTLVNLTVLILDDNVVEPQENFSVLLSSTNSSVQLQPHSAYVVIVDDDTSSYTIEFEENDYEVGESNGQVVICLIVLEDYPVSQEFSVEISTLENEPTDALAGHDFLAATKTVTFSKDSRKACATFQILSDTLFESLEEHFSVTFSIDSSSPLNIQNGEITEAVVRIIDDDRKDLYFQLSGVRIPYNNHTSIRLSLIGEEDNGLYCITDNTNCCGLPNRAGEWYYPNGTTVSTSNRGYDFYRNRGAQFVRLNRRNSVQLPLGRYCCDVPDANQLTQNICINIMKW